MLLPAPLPGCTPRAPMLADDGGLLDERGVAAGCLSDCPLACAMLLAGGARGRDLPIAVMARGTRVGGVILEAAKDTTAAGAGALSRLPCMLGCIIGDGSAWGAPCCAGQEGGGGGGAGPGEQADGSLMERILQPRPTAAATVIGTGSTYRAPGLEA